MSNFRIGQGCDVHAFGPGNEVTLGGVSIPHSKGLIAHSDGDVLLHALTDALLGSLALGDIGKHFPDTDPTYSGADSRVLLKAAYNLVKQQGFELVNADITVIAEKPKMLTHVEKIRANIAADLGVDMSAISVKATTTEKLGFTGREEGIATQAIVLVNRV